MSALSNGAGPGAQPLACSSATWHGAFARRVTTVFTHARPCRAGGPPQLHQAVCSLHHAAEGVHRHGARHGRGAAGQVQRDAGVPVPGVSLVVASTGCGRPLGIRGLVAEGPWEAKGSRVAGAGSACVHRPCMCGAFFAADSMHGL